MNLNEHSVRIKNIDAIQVFDSRGNPTLEAFVELENGTTGSAIVPSGASTGQFEAHELRDGDKEKFLGKSVYRAIENVKGEIRVELVGKDVHQQEEMDQLMIELDGTKNKSRLGANAILGVSMAISRALSNAQGKSLFQTLTDGGGTLLPLPEIQIMGGGAHAEGSIDIQDFMIICTGAESYLQCLEMTFNVFHHCGRLLKKKGKLAGVADEGGYWPIFDSNEELFEILLESIEGAGYSLGEDVQLSLDIAASEFYDNGRYHLNLDNRSLTGDQFYKVISGWCKQYPIISIEDPFAETDTLNWKRFTKEFGNKIQIIGDDLFTTDIKRVKEGKEDKLANSVLIKLNQIGTVTETIECIKQTQEFGWTPVISARSGETEDPFISHLAVATNAGQLKVGSFSRSERMVKWNEILRIERELQEKAEFIGEKIFSFAM
ncbi:phosphopyruvate hydratase [Rhodohalobacter sulfatireducens]|uniref:Enolase n=1 Tax=Rhodohalobacter sulfatireducens TaxID=2911366 RepID=A0ABS9K8V8_9BACT|nr:phosphopyruvate hydratase [Rhodohalobacter sulfatireducens]MCG2587238.1 phosphopyruvate hydratase [Rhodohalobacter sulfatireducens]